MLGGWRQDFGRWFSQSKRSKADINNLLTFRPIVSNKVFRAANNIKIGTAMIFSIRPSAGEADHRFIERLNARLTEVIKAPTHTEGQVASFQQGFTASSWDADIFSNATFVAVNVQDEPIGYVNVREGNDEIAEEKCGYIALLAVVPEVEGQGVAQSLVSKAEEWSRQMGYTRVALDVFASNERGLRFYNKVGFAHETIRVIKKI